MTEKYRGYKFKFTPTEPFVSPTHRVDATPFWAFMLRITKALYERVKFEAVLHGVYTEIPRPEDGIHFLDEEALKKCKIRIIDNTGS